MRAKVSVALAAYNGAPYICTQIDTILACLTDGDELVISDDGSTDETLSIIRSVISRDSRVRLTAGPRRGVIANFEHALGQCSGELIFLADQDDLWLPEKVDVVSAIFAADAEVMCVVHDMEVVDDDLGILHSSYFKARGSRSSLMSNLIRNSYVGAAMAVRASLLAIALPIPPTASMHDLWLGANGALFGRTTLFPGILGRYRRHGSNLTKLNSPGPLRLMLLSRARMAALLLRQSWRYRAVLREVRANRRGVTASTSRDIADGPAT